MRGDVVTAEDRTFALEDASVDDAYAIGRVDGHDRAIHEMHAASDWVYLEAHERRLIAAALRNHAQDRMRYAKWTEDAWAENDRYQQLARRIERGEAS